MYRNGRKIHFVGIGGIGMSGIAEVLLNLGYRVSGSDMRNSPITDRLSDLGAEVTIGHDGENVGDAFVVVTSSAVREENPEVVEAHHRKVPVIPRAEMLAELMRMKYGVAVAGTHGKTTTTSMAGTVLSELGFDPTVVVGGRLGVWGSNARLGQGKFLVAEADESDGSFLLLAPTVAVITNIDREHMDHYGDEDSMERAFVDFANKVPFYGAVIACLDDPKVQELLPQIKRRVITYGISAQADVRALFVSATGAGHRFTIASDNVPMGEVTLCQPGRHNVLNSLAAFAVAKELGGEGGDITRALGNFQGVDRRAQVKGEVRNILVMDDYAHHPTELQTTLEGLGEATGRRVVAVFQPHRYSRTRDLFDRFLTSFYGADVLAVTDIYAAGESPDPKVNATALVEGIASHGHKRVIHIPEVDDVAKTLAPELTEGDLVVTLGAGNVWRAGEALLELLEAKGHG